MRQQQLASQGSNELQGAAVSSRRRNKPHIWALSPVGLQQPCLEHAFRHGRPCNLQCVCKDIPILWVILPEVQGVGVCHIGLDQVDAPPLVRVREAAQCRKLLQRWPLPTGNARCIWDGEHLLAKQHTSQRCSLLAIGSSMGGLCCSRYVCPASTTRNAARCHSLAFYGRVNLGQRSFGQEKLDCVLPVQHLHKQECVPHSKHVHCSPGQRHIISIIAVWPSSPWQQPRLRPGASYIAALALLPSVARTDEAAS